MVCCWPQSVGWMLLTLGGLFAGQPTSPQVGIVTVRSVGELQANFKYLAPLLGQEDLAARVEAYLGQVLDGVDRQRPFGAILHWPEKWSALSSLNLPVVYFVPIADEKLFLKMLERLHCRPR